MIVTFKQNFTEEDVEKVKASFQEMGFEDIKIVKCHNCNFPVQLWKAKGIHTVISGGTGVKAGSGGGTGTVGESYSLNFISKIPPHHWERPSNQSTGEKYFQTKQDVVIVAVLDTGIDPYIVDTDYVSESLENKPGFECFGDLGSGWNFVNDNGDIEDDSPGRHGSLVTQFIINEFKKSSTKTVKIIPLKTHNFKGQGDLFHILCAIYYATAKGANIINASWGFYYYQDDRIELLDTIMNMLKEHGILFVTAAGNQSYDDDLIASKMYYSRHSTYPTPFQLRNLAVHQFLPACLSVSDNNLITVTTTDGKQVASTENYSNIFVDVGVMADKHEDGDLWFKIPFEQTNGEAYVRGSSFATAIATGIIGANCDKNLYKQNSITKKTFINHLLTIPHNLANASLCKKVPALNQMLIKDGICLQK